MNETQWLSDYFAEYQKSIPQAAIYKDLVQLKDWIMEANKAGKKVIFVGNGGSAAMSSHCAVDFTKTAGVRAINFNEADLITCFGNDYGYENWVVEALKAYADKGDVIILISSSGKSPNMVNAAKWAAQNGFKLATVTGFSPENPMRSLGKINLWVNSTKYNIVENTHIIWLLSVCDLVIASK